MCSWYIATAALLGLTIVQALAQVPANLLTGYSLPQANAAGSIGSADAPSGTAPADLGPKAGRKDGLLAARNTLITDHTGQPP